MLPLLLSAAILFGGTPSDAPTDAPATATQLPSEVIGRAIDCPDGQVGHVIGTDLTVQCPPAAVPSPTATPVPTPTPVPAKPSQSRTEAAPRPVARAADAVTEWHAVTAAFVALLGPALGMTP